MERGHPLAHLPAYVAYARSRGRPTRLVLRNTERFGLVYLYFRHGHLTHVEGHAGTPLSSVADLAQWQFGIIRQDDVADAVPDGVASPELENALFGVLKDLESRGVVRPAPPAARAPSVHGAAARASNLPPLSSIPGSGALPPLASDPVSDGDPPIPGASGLPPLEGVAPPEGLASRIGRAHDGPASDRITDPQWQLVALVVHQILEQAVAAVGGRMAEGVLRQALAHAAKTQHVARAIELDDSGWLKVTAGHAISRYTAFDVADAVAAILTSFELRCASLVGAERAQRIIASAAAPFRTSLAQIGLDVSAGA